MNDKEHLGSTYIIIKKNSDKNIKYATDSNRFAQNYRSQVQRVKLKLFYSYQTIY